MKALTVILFAVLVYFLTVNYGCGVTCDEVMQIPQWRQLCIRGIAACAALLSAMAIRTNAPRLLGAIEAALIAVCAVEAAFSVLQLYGFMPSFHSLFKVTGSFYNPGPLGGYIALAVPVIANRLLHFGSEEKSHGWPRVQKYLLWISLCIIAVALPSSMSRTAWIAAAISVIYVLWGNQRIQPLLSRTGLGRRALSVLAAAVASVCLALLWILKRDSAIGRLLLWKISARAMLDSPFAGHPNFAEAYANAQEAYFEGNSAPVSEQMMAGAPDYAFNEYLQIGVEYGIPALLALLAALLFCLAKSYRGKAFGLSGALMSLMVFAFASYPMHLPAFVAAALLIVLGILYFVSCRPIFRRGLAIGLASLMALMAFSIGPLSQKEKALSSWGDMRFLYVNKQYHAVAQRYANISGDMEWNPRFLYEYGHSLYKSGQHAEALPVLRKSALISSDPMVLNVLGECHQALGQYQEAEKCYLRSSFRIPSRLYPHYLLYFLYCEPGFQNSGRRIQEYGSVLSLEIKKESPATRDLRKKVIEREALFGH